MIRAGIAGGNTPAAGEVIKILINHPDVELEWAYAPDSPNLRLSKVHKGLRGETYMCFTDEIPAEMPDVIFLCFDEPGLGRDFVRQIAAAGCRSKLIDLTADMRRTAFDPDSEWVYGLPELNRKPLVRGATRATVPGALSTAVLLGLLPLAKNLMINSTVNVHATIHDEYAEPGEALALLDHEETDDIRDALRTLQSSYNSEMLFVVTAGGFRRGVSVTMYLDCNVEEEEIIKLYNDFYDDHSFTFISENVPSISEVVGTNKCVIHLQRVGSRLVINVVIDDLTKGSATQAVHIMNLIFGLQERVGLMIPAIL